MENIQRIMNDSRYYDTAEAEIEKMLKNAKVSLCQLGFDLDKERLANIDKEEETEVDETELDRLLEGGLAFCRKVKECGHKCAGVKDEDECLPCLYPECVASAAASSFNLPTHDELCTICYTCELREEPSVMLGCGHVFHANCIVELLKHKWATLRITFAFMSCPQCKQPIEANHVYEVAAEIEKLMILRSELQVKAMKIARSQHLDKDERLNTPGDFYFGRLMQFAEAKVCFYMCSRCEKPYFGGLIDCEQEQGMIDTTRREDLMCRPCLIKEMSIGKNIC
mmetsp:Transcript_29171/g.36202  ORF Transcript_29171/g.36202 Transcript_29171/m.36202 type:complete len:282 (-) Transcript_29171:760-1605(-)